MRNKIVDLHHHWMPEAAYRQLGRFLRPGEKLRSGRTHPMLPGLETVGVVRDGATLLNLPPAYLELEGQIRLMDEAKIDKAVIHIGIPQEWNAPRLARVINDGIADAVERFPERLVGLAHVPQLGQEGIDELRRATQELGFRGLGVVTNIDGVYPDSEKWGPLLQEADRLGLPIVVHPTSLPHHMQASDDDTKGYSWGRIVGRAYDLSVFTMRLITGGVLERYPNLSFVISHTGGTFFALAETYLARADPGTIAEWRGRLFFDTAVRTGKNEILQAAEALGPDSLVFGSDFPFCRLEERVRLLDDLNRKDREKVLHGNADLLFKT